MFTGEWSQRGACFTMENYPIKPFNSSGNWHECARTSHFGNKPRMSVSTWADHTTVQHAVCEETYYHMSHLQLATTHQLGLYLHAGDVFSSGIFPSHCCPARKTSPSDPLPKLNKENGSASIRSEASLPWKELSVENVSGKKKKKKANSRNHSCHIFQSNSERWQKEKEFFEKLSYVLAPCSISSKFKWPGSYRADSSRIEAHGIDLKHQTFHILNDGKNILNINKTILQREQTHQCMQPSKTTRRQEQ